MDFVLPTYDFSIRQASGSKSLFSNRQMKTEVFDMFRKRWVRLTPEEGVRQRVLRYLVDSGYPEGRIGVEQEIDVNGTRKRCDAIIYDANGVPAVIVECKAPGVKLAQRTFDQAAVYNSVLNVPYLLLTNGTTHYFCRVNSAERKYVMFDQFPKYDEIVL